MKVNVFLFSILLSSIGAFLDQYSTRIFIREIGLEYESNTYIKKLIKKCGEKRGYLYWICIEIFFIIIWGFIDSLPLNNYLFFGLVWFIGRGLISISNFQFIQTYRKIGIDNYKKQDQLRRDIPKKRSFYHRLKRGLIYFVIFFCFLIIIFTSNIVLRSILSGLVGFILVKARLI